MGSAVEGVGRTGLLCQLGAVPQNDRVRFGRAGRTGCHPRRRRLRRTASTAGLL